jgi:hypothetical protein
MELSFWLLHSTGIEYRYKSALLQRLVSMCRNGYRMPCCAVNPNSMRPSGVVVHITVC